jgi:hypothetical protein
MISFPQAVIWNGMRIYAENMTGPIMFFLMLPPFFLAPSFLILSGCLYRSAPENRKIHGLLAMLFFGVYAAQITFNYYIQLTVVSQNLSTGNWDGLALWAFFNPVSIGMNLELLGYGMLSVGLVFISFIFRGEGGHRGVFWIFFINGVLNALYIFEPFIRLGGPPVVMAMFTFTMPVGTAMTADWLRRRKIT